MLAMAALQLHKLDSASASVSSAFALGTVERLDGVLSSALLYSTTPEACFYFPCAAECFVTRQLPWRRLRVFKFSRVAISLDLSCRCWEVAKEIAPVAFSILMLSGRRSKAA